MASRGLNQGYFLLLQIPPSRAAEDIKQLFFHRLSAAELLVMSKHKLQLENCQSAPLNNTHTVVDHTFKSSQLP